MIALCLSKENLMNLMHEYPDARNYYFEAAFERRTEIRRRMRRFYQQIERTNVLNKLLQTKIEEPQGSSFWQSDSHSQTVDYFNDDQCEDQNDLLVEEDIELTEDSLECSIIKNERKMHIDSQKYINSKISKFFVNVDFEKELKDDYDTDDLEAVSEDE